MIRIGSLLYGYCGGCFGSSYKDKRVEAVGTDWVVAREVRGEPVFYQGCPEDLESFLEPEGLDS